MREEVIVKGRSREDTETKHFCLHMISLQGIEWMRERFRKASASGRRRKGDEKGATTQWWHEAQRYDDRSAMLIWEVHFDMTHIKIAPLGEEWKGSIDDWALWKGNAQRTLWERWCRSNANDRSISIWWMSFMIQYQTELIVYDTSLKRNRWLVHERTVLGCNSNGDMESR